MLDRRRGLPVGQQRHRHQQRQRRAGQERRRSIDARDLQHERPQGEAGCHQHRVEAHDTAAALLLDDHVHPDLAHHPRHAAGQAVQKTEHEPGDGIAGEGVGNGDDRARHNGDDDQRDGPEPRRHLRNARPEDQHAEAPGGGNDSDGELVRPLPLQRQRHQRDRNACLQPDGGTGQEDGEKRAPGIRGRASPRHAGGLPRGRTAAPRPGARPRRPLPAGAATCRHRGRCGPAGRHAGRARRSGHGRGPRSRRH